MDQLGFYDARLISHRCRRAAAFDFDNFLATDIQADNAVGNGKAQRMISHFLKQAGNERY